jgi:hypothetical protein
LSKKIIMGDYALKYAQQGLAMFPVKPKGKVPICEHGVKDATTDEAQIREWWQKEPEANIGLAAGR